jgi:hypothetical protein
VEHAEARGVGEVEWRVCGGQRIVELKHGRVVAGAKHLKPGVFDLLVRVEGQLCCCVVGELWEGNLEEVRSFVWREEKNVVVDFTEKALAVLESLFRFVRESYKSWLSCEIGVLLLSTHVFL